MYLCISHCVKPTDGCKPGKVQSALDTGGAAYLNGAKFTPLSSLIINKDAMGHYTMPEIRSLWISLLIAIATEQEIEDERQFKGYVRTVRFCCIIDFPPWRFA
jgi:hypothetical protein